MRAYHVRNLDDENEWSPSASTSDRSMRIGRCQWRPRRTVSRIGDFVDQVLDDGVYEASTKSRRLAGRRCFGNRGEKPVVAVLLTCRAGRSTAGRPSASGRTAARASVLLRRAGGSAPSCPARSCRDEIQSSTGARSAPASVLLSRKRSDAGAESVEEQHSEPACCPPFTLSRTGPGEVPPRAERRMRSPRSP